jgi:hypothetical protein
MGQIFGNMYLLDSGNITFCRAVQPLIKLADIPHIGRNRIQRRLLYLSQVVFIGPDQIQHRLAPFCKNTEKKSPFRRPIQATKRIENHQIPCSLTISHGFGNFKNEMVNHVIFVNYAKDYVNKFM